MTSGDKIRSCQKRGLLDHELIEIGSMAHLQQSNMINCRHAASQVCKQAMRKLSHFERAGTDATRQTRPNREMELRDYCGQV
jgi:hypothetical protein